jgi:hypothetical protein
MDDLFEKLKPYMAVVRGHFHRNMYGECPVVAADIMRALFEMTGKESVALEVGVFGGYAKKRDGGSIHTARRPSQALVLPGEAPNVAAETHVACNHDGEGTYVKFSKVLGHVGAMLPAGPERYGDFVASGHSVNYLYVRVPDYEGIVLLDGNQGQFVNADDADFFVEANVIDDVKRRV